MSKRTNLDSSNPDYKPENDPLAQIPRRFDRSFLSSAWRLAKPYLMESEERWKARGLLLATVVITLLLVVINLQITNWFNRFYNALQGYDQAGFWKLLGEFTLLAFAAIALSVYQTYLSQLFDLRWRKWLTGDYLRRYLSAQTYYHMEVFKRGQDNPDQRIADDLSQFSQLTTSLFTGMLSAIANLVAFIGLLWVLSAKVVIPWSGGEHHVPGFLVWVALIYAVAWTWVAAKIGNPLIWLNFNQQRLQADFRFSLMRLRENSEAVAFYRGEAMERDHFDRRFDRVYHNYKRLILRQKRFNWFSSYFSQVAVILPFLATASAYFAKAVPLGFLMQVSSAFGNVQGSFAYLAQSYDSFAQWHAVVDRLRGFVGLVDEVERIKDHENRIEQQDGQELLVDDLRVLLPGGGVLHEGLNLKVATGEHLLITGPSGAGKSTLLRALAGIWPFGEGRVIRPQGERSLFLPQRPYLPMGTLRDAILYPGVKGQVDDESIQVLLEAIGLPRLYGYLDEVEPWSQVLSLGEQQRLAIGRALLQRPDCLFMDESTSALDEPSEAELYRLLFEHLPQTAIISVGHRSTLRQLHERALVLAGSRDEVEQTNVVEQEI